MKTFMSISFHLILAIIQMIIMVICFLIAMPTGIAVLGLQMGYNKGRQIALELIEMLSAE